MFENLTKLPDDPILGLVDRIARDDNPRKVDLCVGVYKDEQGRVPIMAAVARGERQQVDNQPSKAYMGIAGDREFNRAIENLVFGETARHLSVDTAQTPGGCAALFAIAMLVKDNNPGAVVWVSDPTWVNHGPVLRRAGLETASYPYYDHSSHQVSFDRMLQTLDRAREGDVVLLHGCCHNPTGADLDADQWQAVIELVRRKKLLPVIDLAYQGLGEGLDEDAAGLRDLAQAVPELLVATSCSKNFGLYRDRVGALSVVAASEERVEAIFSHCLAVIRSTYSMPPAHGAGIVREILASAELRGMWTGELAAMRERIQTMRAKLASGLEARTERSWDYLIREKGMFSFINLSPQSVSRLRNEYSLYVLDSGRLNVCGLNDGNIDRVADAIAAVVKLEG